MNAVADAAAKLKAALDTVALEVETLRVHTDPDAVLDPPAVVIGPPVLTWSSYCVGSDPDEAKFPVVLAVKADSLAMERLWELVPTVAAALESVRDVTVSTAEPLTWGPPDKSFPAYRFTVSVALGQ